MNSALKVRVADLELNGSSSAVLRTLLYFDIFNYPLTLKEILTYSAKASSSEDLEETVEYLIQLGLVFRFEHFYTVQNNPTNISRRHVGNAEAAKNIPMAQARANWIGKFPFVKGVMASGSLSKGYMDEKSDLDFFVVTDPHRLWIARTIFILYRKFFIPRNRYREFCLNYLVTSDRLEIEEKNLFTATELVTLIPLYGADIHKKLLQSNDWVERYLPNFQIPAINVISSHEESFSKKVFEIIISLFFAKRLDRFLMGLTLKVFKRKYGERFSDAEFSLAFKSKPHVSKAHLGNHQKKVLCRLQEKIDEFETRFDVAFNDA